jgi:hypothetical protein
MLKNYKYFWFNYGTVYSIATNMLLTANGGNFNGTGAVRIVCHYIALEPPTK